MHNNSNCPPFQLFVAREVQAVSAVCSIHYCHKQRLSYKAYNCKMHTWGPHWGTALQCRFDSIKYGCHTGGALCGPNGITLNVYFFCWDKKRNFVPTGWVHRYLMIPRTSIKANEIQPAMTLTKFVNGVVASWHGTFKGKSDGIEVAVANVHSLYKI